MVPRPMLWRLMGHVFPYLLALVVGCSRSDVVSSSKSQSGDGSDAGSARVTVVATKVALTTLHPTIDLVGSVVAIPERTAVVSAQQGGWVCRLAVVEGQEVKEGDLLVQLDPRSAEVAVEKARSVVMQQQAVVERLERGYLPEEIAAARQDVQQAEARVEALRNELSALQKLLSRGEISNVAYENKEKTYEAARAAAASATERLKLLEAGTRPEMIAEAQGQLEAARADLKQAELLLDWCTVTSPIDGVVTQLLARRGQYFDRAAPLATVVDLARVFAQVSVPAVEFRKIALQTPARVTLKAFPGKSFSGTVDRISGVADPRTGNVTVFVLVRNEDGALHPGFSCQVRFALPSIPRALVVPRAAVADNSGTPVVTVIRDGKAFETPVRTGVEAGGLVQITQGLSAGDIVATEGGYGLPAGCPVAVSLK